MKSGIKIKFKIKIRKYNRHKIKKNLHTLPAFNTKNINHNLKQKLKIINLNYIIEYKFITKKLKSQFVTNIKKI